MIDKELLSKVIDLHVRDIEVYYNSYLINSCERDFDLPHTEDYQYYEKEINIYELAFKTREYLYVEYGFDLTLNSTIESIFERANLVYQDIKGEEWNI